MLTRLCSNISHQPPIDFNFESLPFFKYVKTKKKTFTTIFLSPNSLLWSYCCWCQLRLMRRSEYSRLLYNEYESFMVYKCIRTYTHTHKNTICIIFRRAIYSIFCHTICIIFCCAICSIFRNKHLCAFYLMGG